MNQAAEILAELSRERSKFTGSESDRVAALVNLLVEIGVYPATSSIGLPALKMVESWGVDWHEYRGPLACPHCGADLRNVESGPPFKREIAIVDRGTDRVACWQCLDCGHEWERGNR